MEIHGLCSNHTTLEPSPVLAFGFRSHKAPGTRCPTCALAGQEESQNSQITDKLYITDVFGNAAVQVAQLTSSARRELRELKTPKSGKSDGA
ncbi:hypothetical protein NXS19_005586 [Fusarium pseudograminearum]|nr:hypothetical protein NXS19_005586 [Fusarium pseudograminearum]